MHARPAAKFHRSSFAEIGHGKYGEPGQGDDFLNRSELSGAEFEGADAISRDLKAVFKKRDPPTE